MSIDNQQKRLDKLDKKEDKKINIDGKDYSNTIINQVDSLIYNLDYFSDEMKSEIQDELYNDLLLIDENNIKEASTELSIKIDAWISGEEVCETDLVITEEFYQINNSLNISEDNLQTYYESAVENKVDISKMRIQLEEIDQYFLTEIEHSLKQSILITIFGKLVNGETKDLINDEVLNLNIISCSKKIKKDELLLNNLKTRLDEEKELQKKQIEKISKLTVANADWFLWASRGYENFDNEIAKAIKDLESIDTRIATYNKRILETENVIKETTTASLLSQYQYISKNGEDTTAFVLMIKDKLGDNIPSFIQPEIDQVLYNLPNNPNISEFDKLFYEGRYDEALELLVDNNKEKLGVAGIGGRESEFDIVNTYERNFEPDQLEKKEYQDREDRKRGRELQFLGEIQDNFPENSFATQKINKEGYKLIQIVDEKTRGSNGTINRNNGKKTPRNNRINLFLVKRSEDGSLKYLRIKSDGEKFGIHGDDPNGIMANLAAEYTINPEKQDQIKSEDLEMKSNMLRLISTKPSFKMLQSAGAELNKKVAPLNQLFHKSLEGEKTDSFVSLLKSQARGIKNSSALGDLKSNLEQAKKDLRTIKSFANSGIQDEFEQQISKLEKSLSKVSSTISNNKIENFCDYIISADFDADTWGRWVLETGLPFLTAIGVAVVAIVLAVPSGGTSVVGGLAIMAGVGTAAGMVGHELGTIASHHIGQAIYGEDEFSNKTLLGKALTGEKVYDFQTGEYREIKGSELAKVYGKQFVVGFVTTFALLGLGQVAGQYLSRFAAANTASSGAKGAAARLLEKLPRLGKLEVDLIRAQGFDKLSTRIAKEFFEELGQESFETAAQQGHWSLGYLASLYNCLNGRRVEYNLGGFDVSSEGSFKVGENDVLTKWSYNSSKQTEIVSKLTDEYGAQGFVIETQVDGTVIVKKTQTSKSGQEYNLIMEFRGTTENVHMRRLFGHNIENGESEIKRLYGVENISGNNYFYKNTTAEGVISLQEYLKKEGFVIGGNISNGEFTAKRGDETINFGQAEFRATIESEKIESEKTDHISSLLKQEDAINSEMLDVLDDYYKWADYIEDEIRLGSTIEDIRLEESSNTSFINYERYLSLKAELETLQEKRKEVLLENISPNLPIEVHHLYTTLAKNIFDKIDAQKDILDEKGEIYSQLIQYGPRPLLESKIEEFMEILENGDQNEISYFMNSHLRPGTQDGFMMAWHKSFEFLLAKHKISKLSNDLILLSETSRNMDPSKIQKLIEKYPGNNEVFAFIELHQYYKSVEELRAKGLNEVADELMNFDITYSMVDGSPIRTVEERVAFLEKLNSLNETELYWYKNRPPSEENINSPNFKQASAELKEFTNNFISEKLMPELIASGKSLDQIAVEIHQWQTKGSGAQLEILTEQNSWEFGKNIAGEYRNVSVRVSYYICPNEVIIPELMSKFDAMNQRIDSELREIKDTVSPAEFEKIVVQYAAHVQQTFVDIHPFRDGNGRTSRMLYQYTINKYLDKNNSFKNIPLVKRTDEDALGEITLHDDLVDINGEIQARDYPSRGNSLETQQLAGDNLSYKLENITLEEIMDDSLLIKYRETIVQLIENPT